MSFMKDEDVDKLCKEVEAAKEAAGEKK